MGGSPGDISEEPVTYEKGKKGWRMSCDVGIATEGLENELWRWSDGKVGEWAELVVIVIAELILQPFRHFPYVTTHSPTLPSLYLRHSSFSNPSVASPTSSSFSNPSFASPTSQALRLIHLASRPWATLAHHSAVVVNMWTLASTSPVSLHGL